MDKDGYLDEVCVLKNLPFSIISLKKLSWHFDLFWPRTKLPLN